MRKQKYQKASNAVIANSLPHNVLMEQLLMKLSQQMDVAEVQQDSS
jgi:hypothetical protein